MLHPLFNSPLLRRYLLPATGVSVLLTFALFLVIVFADWVRSLPTATPIVHEVSLISPIQEKSHEATPPTDKDTSLATQQSIQTELPLANFPVVPAPSSRETLVNDLPAIPFRAGNGDALHIGVTTGNFSAQPSIGNFGLDTTTKTNFGKNFSFEELQHPPSVLFVPSITFPKEMVRRNVREATVEMIILIDEVGKVKVENIVSSSHPIFENIAKEAAEHSLFSITKVDGNPVKVRGKWPLIIQQP